MKYFVVIICALVSTVLASKDGASSARIESCSGCSLNRLPEVKKFIVEDAKEYEGVAVKYIGGAPPELVLLDETDQEIERLPLSQLNRDECNQLLQNKGFIRNQKSNSEF